MPVINGNYYPTSSVLFLNAILEKFFILFSLPQWRSFLPFCLGENDKDGWLSRKYSINEGMALANFPVLLSYKDFLAQTGSSIGLKSMFNYSFHTRSTALGCLTSFESIIVLLLLVLILRVLKYFFLPIFCKIGENVGICTHGKEWGKKKDNQERIQKFGEYVYRLIYHSTITIIGILYSKDKVWWDMSNNGTESLWLDYPNQPIDVAMIWYYLVQGTYNLEALWHLLSISFSVSLRNPFPSKSRKLCIPVKIEWSPTCRGDFKEMALHHIVTNMLVIYSSHFRFTRIGSMVFILHDISDVPVDLSKLANFIKWKLGTIIFFVTMVILWAITRLGILPFVILKSILKESHLLLISSDLVYELLYCAYKPFFVLLLSGIIMLHLFWFYNFIKIGLLLVKKGEAHDLTEHKNGEKISLANETSHKDLIHKKDD
mmetsp:Transcript_10648/g.15028  ORF Transcript_10648/g.15028 Transcript_10648/m.15028 type:complete len:431 (+) Transcript_10648:62-1354(+)